MAKEKTTAPRAIVTITTGIHSRYETGFAEVVMGGAQEKGRERVPQDPIGKYRQGKSIREEFYISRSPALALSSVAEMPVIAGPSGIFSPIWMVYFPGA